MTTKFVLCVGILCTELLAPVNGRIEFSSGSPGDQLFGVTGTYICDFGLGIARGERVRTCEGNGSSTAGYWTGIAPLCRSTLLPCMYSLYVYTPTVAYALNFSVAKNARYSITLSWRDPPN